LAATLWRKYQGKSRRVNSADLEVIAKEFDRSGFVPASGYSSRAAAQALREHNRRYGNSGAGKRIGTWSELVTRGDMFDKRFVADMRKLLSECARNSEKRLRNKNKVNRK